MKYFILLINHLLVIVLISRGIHKARKDKGKNEISIKTLSIFYSLIVMSITYAAVVTVPYFIYKSYNEIVFGSGFLLALILAKRISNLFYKYLIKKYIKKRSEDGNCILSTHKQ